MEASKAQIGWQLTPPSRRWARDRQGPFQQLSSDPITYGVKRSLPAL